MDASNNGVITAAENPKADLSISEIASAINPARNLNRRAVTGALMIVMVLSSMEQTVTSTAMPSIIGSLHGLEHYSWVASIYLLACTVSMPLAGRLADSLGRKRVILFSISLFILSSLLAATAHSMPHLIVYRGIQGLGAGGIMPVVLTILGDIFTIEERAKIQGFFSGVWGTASLAGPALGAFLVKAFGWPSIFMVNVPFGILAILVLIISYHDPRRPHKVELDLSGIGLLAAGCMSLLMLVSHLGPDGWSTPMAIGLAIAAIASMILFVVHERKSDDPIMPVDLLLDRAIGPCLLGSCLLGIGFLSLDTFVPLYVQGGLGGGPGAAAWVVTPVMLTWALSGILAAPMVVKFGFRAIAACGSVLTCIGFIGLIVCVKVEASRPVLAAVLAITGLGFGPASMSFLLSAQNACSWQRRGIVTSGIVFVRTVGGAVGIGILGTVFNIITQPKLQSLSGIHPSELLDPQRRAQLPPDILQSAGEFIIEGLHWVFYTMLAVAIMQVIVPAMMPKRKPDHAISALEAAEAMGG